MRKLFGGAAEDLCEPPDPFLMRYVHEGAVAEDIRQGVLAGLRLPLRHLLRRPKVPPPGHQRQRKENRHGSCYKNCCQNTDGAGSCLASVAVTRAAHSAGAGATTEISPSQTEGAATKATSVSFW